MSIFILGNREVKLEGKKERFVSDGRDSPSPSRPNFRIARWIDGSKPDYEMLPDTFELEYEDVAEAIKKKDNSKKFNGSAQMFYELYWNMLNDDGPSDVLFFIHGFATSFEDELQHIAQLKKLYLDPKNSPTKHMVYVSWPTRNNVFLTYSSDQYDAKITGDNIGRLYFKLSHFFQTLFKQFKQQNCGSKIHLMAHSMGNQVLEYLMRSLKDRYIIPLIGEVLLLHADADHDIFESGKPFTKLAKLAHRTHIYIHKSDDALTISTLTKNFTARLGKRGPSNKNNLNQETFIIDVTGVGYKRSNSFLKRFKNATIDHWGYLYSNEVITDIYKVLNGQDENRIVNRVRHDKFPNYYIIKESKNKETFVPNMMIQSIEDSIKRGN